MRYCLAVPWSSDCQTIADTSRVVGSCWLCGAHRTRADAAACETRGNPDRGMSSSAFHTTSQRPAQSAAGNACATVWIATSFRARPCVFVHTLACRCSQTEFSSMPSHAAAAARALCSCHHSPRVRQLSDSRCSAARRSTAPGRHGHQTTPFFMVKSLNKYINKYTDGKKLVLKPH